MSVANPGSDAAGFMHLSRAAAESRIRYAHPGYENSREI